jgi:hypothetical protein
MCGLIFVYNSSLILFFILRRIQRKTLTYISIPVKYPLFVPDVNET